jgi:hypothetical protein
MSRTSLQVSAVLVALVIGAGLTTLAGQTPAAPAPAAGPRAKWEYKVVTAYGVAKMAGKADEGGGAINERQAFADGIDKLGDEGWELTAATEEAARQPVYYFKRLK